MSVPFSARVPSTWSAAASSSTNLRTTSREAPIAVEALPFYECEAKRRMNQGGLARPGGVETPTPEEADRSREHAAAHFGVRPRSGVGDTRVIKARRRGEEAGEVFIRSGLTRLRPRETAPGACHVLAKPTWHESVIR